MLEQNHSFFEMAKQQLLNHLGRDASSKKCRHTHTRSTAHDTEHSSHTTHTVSRHTALLAHTHIHTIRHTHTHTRNTLVQAQRAQWLGLRLSLPAAGVWLRKVSRLGLSKEKPPIVGRP